MNKTLKGVILTLMGGICWGFGGTCGEFLFKFKGFDPNWVSCARLLIGGIILVALALLREKKSAFNIFKRKSSALTLVAFGIFGLMVSQYSYLTTISHSNSGTATILQYTGLAIILLVVCLRDWRLPRLFESVAVVFALIGMFLIATHGDISAMVVSRECLFWGIVSALGLVCYSLIPLRILKEHGAMPVSGFGMIIGGIVLAFFVRPWQYAISLDFAAMLALSGVIIVGTVIAYNLYLVGVSIIGPVKAGMIGAIEPVAAAVFSAFWIGSKFTAIDILGFALIISTVFLINIPSKKERLSR